MSPDTQKQVATFNHPAEKGDMYGYAPAVKVGQNIYVSGQTASNTSGDMATQMQEAYRSIQKALAQLGASMSDVVEETLYVTDMDAAAQCAARVRSEVYEGRFQMASNLIGVQRLGHPDFVIEIKCTAQLT